MNNPKIINLRAISHTLLVEFKLTSSYSLILHLTYILVRMKR